MLERLFKETIKKYLLCEPTDRILAAVSGGKDSMALLDLFRRNNYYLQVAHFNYKLRGEASDSDENLVREYCQKYGLTLHVKTEKTEEFAKKNSLSVQVAARDLRYSWFKKLLKDNGLRYVATAHHLNDNLETLLYNFTKGTSYIGLTGIPVKTHQIIRPMLHAKSEEVKTYLIDNQIKWREDKSNEKNDYARNRIRNLVIPELKVINPGLESTFETNLVRFKAINEIIQVEIDFFKSRIKHTDKAKILSADLLKNTKGISVILENYLKEYNFNFSDVETVLSINHSGKVLKSATHTLTYYREQWILEDISEKPSLSFTFSQPGTYQNNHFKITFELLDLIPENLSFANPNIIFLDAENIIWPLEIRVWETGDKFKPFGMKGFKTVSDFLSDLKIGFLEKRSQLVLKDADRILWVMSRRINDDCKISTVTSKCMMVKLEKTNEFI